jgi:hypothetical protein
MAVVVGLTISSGTAQSWRADAMTPLHPSATPIHEVEEIRQAKSLLLCNLPAHARVSVAFACHTVAATEVVRPPSWMDLLGHIKTDIPMRSLVAAFYAAGVELGGFYTKQPDHVKTRFADKDVLVVVYGRRRENGNCSVEESTLCLAILCKCSTKGSDSDGFGDTDLNVLDGPVVRAAPAILVRKNGPNVFLTPPDASSKSKSTELPSSSTWTLCGLCYSV